MTDIMEQKITLHTARTAYIEHFFNDPKIDLHGAVDVKNAISFVSDAYADTHKTILDVYYFPEDKARKKRMHQIMGLPN